MRCKCSGKLIATLGVLLTIAFAQSVGVGDAIRHTFGDNDESQVSVVFTGSVPVDYNIFDNDDGLNGARENWDGKPGLIDICDSPPEWWQYHRRKFDDTKPLPEDWWKQLYDYKPDVRNIKVQILQFSYPGKDLGEVYQELRRRGLRPLKSTELLGLALESPYLFESNRVIFALGEMWRSRWQNQGNPHEFLALYKSVHTPTPLDTVRPGFRYNFTTHSTPEKFSGYYVVAATPE